MGDTVPVQVSSHLRLEVSNLYSPRNKASALTNRLPRLTVFDVTNQQSYRSLEKKQSLDAAHNEAKNHTALFQSRRNGLFIIGNILCKGGRVQRGGRGSEGQS